MLELSKKIDYTNLEEQILAEDLILLCKKAIKYNVASVCILPKFIKQTKQLLINTNIKLCTVISFPKGNNKKIEKISQTKQAISDGADEIDMVFNYKLLKKYWSKKKLPKIIEEELITEIFEISKICNLNNCLLKVIIESGLLTKEQTKIAAEICIKGNTNYIKTSTGKVKIGAEPQKVNVIREVINKLNTDVKIKISGGIRTLDDIKKYDKYNISRIGMGYKSADEIFTNFNLA